MDVETPFVADGEPSEAVHPREGALDDPAVSAELLTAFNAAPGDSRLYAAPMASSTAAAVIIGLVCVQFARAPARASTSATNGWDCIEQRFERHAVVDVGAGQQEGERDATAVGDEVSLGAGPPTVSRVWAGCRTPLFAAMDALSIQARLQSIRSPFRSRRSNSRCRRSHTPAHCQSRSRRQHVTPEPHPISRGSISHGMPVRSTNKIPVSAARADTGGRPPFGFGRSGGRRVQ